MKDRALIIFTRNPELGKCKTRLAKTIGDHAALEIYKYLLKHTAEVTSQIYADRYVFYSETINASDLWDDKHFNKRIQRGTDLGERMLNAFRDLFEMNYKHVLIIGSDLPDLSSEIIENAFEKLESGNVVIGPAQDGGYYLLGMNELIPDLFSNKEWGTSSVYEATKDNLQKHKVSVLRELNDIDTFEDLIPYDNLKPLYETHDKTTY